MDGKSQPSFINTCSMVNCRDFFSRMNSQQSMSLGRWHGVGPVSLSERERANGTMSQKPMHQFEVSATLASKLHECKTRSVKSKNIAFFMTAKT